MKIIDNIDIEATLKKARALFESEKETSAAMKSMFEILILIITLLANRLTLNSNNSSKPPSSDPNRKKVTKRKTNKKVGGQKGRIGITLEKIKDPDKIEIIEVDRKKLPPGEYREIGFESRQVFDLDISRIVTEYKAQVLESVKGKRFTATFPPGVTKAAQYGTGIKAQSVYMSQFQLIPYKRIQDYFEDQVHIPISEGSIFNFNAEAFDLLEKAEIRIKDELAISKQAHADETGINIGGKKHWLHCVSNKKWTNYYPHSKRGMDAMKDMNILPRFNGILSHDHWKPYYKLDCTHSLCNAHHLRELTRAWEQDNQKWAEKMKILLETINSKVNDLGGILPAKLSQKYRKKYRDILKKAEIECPSPKTYGKKGRVKKSKARNLLERLKDYEQDTLRFMEDKNTPFSNNLGENDIRMVKVQQKISGCFRSMDGAKIFCRIRGYLSTCRKHNIKSSHALDLLFNGALPYFLM